MLDLVAKVRPMQASPDSPDIRLRVGARIRAARKDKGYSQAELARLMVAAGAATMTKDQVSRWEHGRQMPRPENITLLERILGVLLV